jgi:hypothetical protein
MSSPLARSLLAASLCLAPLGWAAAQDQQPQDQQHQRDHQEHQQEHNQPQQQHAQPQQQHTQQAPQGNAAPQGQHPGGGGQSGGEHQFQRPAQNNPAPPPQQQQFQRPAQTNAAPPAPPAGATALPTPPAAQGQQFQRGQRPPQSPPQNTVAAPAGAAPQSLQQPAQQQQQQFQQRDGQRGAGAPVGSAAPQAQSQQRFQQRSNVQGGNHGNTTVIFTQQHGGYAPAQFNRGRFYGHDYAHFSPHEMDMWHRGGWHHEFRNGRYGWWYAVDDIWYFYDRPIYPYPTYVPDVVYIPEEDEDYDDAPYQPGPPPAQYGQPATYYYYFCQDSQTYYPYVSSCASPWQPVPAAPAPQ